MIDELRQQRIRDNHKEFIGGESSGTSNHMKNDIPQNNTLIHHGATKCAMPTFLALGSGEQPDAGDMPMGDYF